MKKSLIVFLLIGSSFFLRAQNVLQVQHTDKGLFLKHKVAPKENFYSVGRLYNIPPKDIAAANGTDMAKGLVIGQEVLIPLTAANFSQEATNGRAVYYVVGEKEGLYRVSLKNNKVLMANLRKWNHLATDQITTGQKLIVGYLLSPEAGNIVVQAPVPEKKEAVPAPATPVVADKPKEAKEKGEETASRPAPPKAEEKKPAPAVVNKPVSSTIPQGPISDGNGGYFKPSYEKQSKAQAAGVDQTATAGIFKTASGWQDAKYYALMDGVEPGTIVRIINPSNNKAVYAKVLGQMAGIRQNQGYDLRLSNAAASALEVSDIEKFVVRVNY